MAGASVQNEQVLLHEHVVEMTKAGAFDHHLAAQRVYLYYCMRVAINDSPVRGLRRGFVMDGCTSSYHVSAACGITERAVRKVNEWLIAQHMIEKVGDSIEIRSHNGEAEALRVKLVAELSSAEKELSSGLAEPSSGAPIVDLRKHRRKDLTKDIHQSGGTK